MICFHTDGKQAIQKAVQGATEGLICTPFYSERGLNLLDSFFTSAEKIEFWTRLNPLDWRNGVADMAALRQRVQSVLDRGKTFDFRFSDDLHAKIYSFSNGRVIIGSPNLTWPAMTSNIEVICELTEDHAAGFLPTLSNFRNRLTPIATDVFTAYVDVVADVVSRPTEGPSEEDGDMNKAIELAEEVLRESLARTAPQPSTIPPFELKDFKNYCAREKSPVSTVIIQRMEGKDNLQGHVKHCYYGALRFLSEFPGLVDEIAATPHDSLYHFNDSRIRTKWRDFLRRHASEIDEERNFSFRTLRVYIPESLGGTCVGGGGGSPTLKRVLPVLARMLRSLRRSNGRG